MKELMARVYIPDEDELIVTIYTRGIAWFPSSDSRDTARRAYHPAQNDRVSFIVPEEEGWGFGFGDVMELGPTWIDVIDRKFDGAVIRVDRALVTKVTRF